MHHSQEALEFLSTTEEEISPRKNLNSTPRDCKLICKNLSSSPEQLESLRMVSLRTAPMMSSPNQSFKTKTQKYDHTLNSKVITFQRTPRREKATVISKELRSVKVFRKLRQEWYNAKFVGVKEKRRNEAKDAKDGKKQVKK